MDLKPLPQCCRMTVTQMQGIGELGSALKLFLAASPFVLILPDLLPPGSAAEAAETLGEKLIVMAGETVVTNVTKTGALPDFSDAVMAAHDIALNRMHQMAKIHALRHKTFATEGRLWAAFDQIYSPDGKIRQGGSSWDFNPFW